MEERLQKIISRAGIASRRRAEELIVAGDVTVNGQPVTELGSKADPSVDVITVHGKKIESKPPEPLYFALYKPRGCVTTTDDPEGRPTVMDLLGRYRDKVYPVGRLDYHSEGLLLLTNDGDFANHILSAKSKVPKKYSVKVNGMLAGSQLEKFRKGVYLDDGRRTAPALIRMSRVGPNPWYEVTLSEGRNRQIRRMFQALGFQVEKIKRTEIGPLELGRMKTGEVRTLTPREVHWMLHPEDAPPKRLSASRGRGPSEPRELRPMVRRTAQERVAAGEKLDLRIHDQEEPPERRAPAVRRTPQRAGRSVGRGPSRPPLRRAEGQATAKPGERRPLARPARAGAGGRTSSMTSSMRDRAAGKRTGARAAARLPLPRNTSTNWTRPETRPDAKAVAFVSPRPEGRAETPPRSFAPTRPTSPMRPEPRSERPAARIQVGPKSDRDGGFRRNAPDERRPAGGFAVGPKSEGGRSFDRGRPPRRDDDNRGWRGNDRGPRRDDRGPRDGGFRPREGGFRPKDGRHGDDRGPRDGGFRPKDGGFRPKEGGFRPKEGGFRPKEGGFRPKEGPRGDDRPERRPPGGFVVGPKSDRPPRRDNEGGGFRSDDRGRPSPPRPSSGRPSSSSTDRGPIRPPLRDSGRGDGRPGERSGRPAGPRPFSGGKGGPPRPSRGPVRGGPSRGPSRGGPSRGPSRGGPSRGPGRGGPSRGPGRGR